MKRLPALGLVLSACIASSLPRAEGREPKSVAIAGFRFAPAELTVSSGDTITWTNDDTFQHTTASDSGVWTSPELGRGQRFVYVASRPGRYPYHCAAHPVMRATIVVRE
jgi:plastocyanin